MSDASRYAPHPGMVTQFVLRPDKPDSAGRGSVHLLIYFEGARFKCATGEKCRPADWNADWQQFRCLYPLADDANALLARLATQVWGWWRGVRAAEDMLHANFHTEQLSCARRPQ